MLVEAVLRRGFAMEMNSTTPVRYLTGFPAEIYHRFIPGPVTLFQRATRVLTPHWLNDLDGVFFDNLSARFLGQPDLVFGASSSSLQTLRAAHKLGARFVLDRACPDIRVQLAISQMEADKLGAKFPRSAQWFVDRQIQEYDEADWLLAPSEFSRSSYPQRLQSKILVAPLLGRILEPCDRATKPAGGPFTVGVVGGDPLRKGYVYLLEAWKALALPDSRLLIRSGENFERYPVLAKLLTELKNVEIVDYVQDMSSFYSLCDAFVLPSIDDGFGMALFEALAHGTPCVATRNCGASELLSDEVDALIVDAYSPEQLAMAIQRLHSDDGLRVRLGAAGKAAVKALQPDGIPLPYERGMDSLFQALGVGTERPNLA